LLDLVWQERFGGKKDLARVLQIHIEHIAVEKVSEALHFLVHR
jgi:hypothetical protein